MDPKKLEKLFDFDTFGMGDEPPTVGGGYEEQHIPPGAMAYAPGASAPFGELLRMEEEGVGGIGGQMGGARTRGRRYRRRQTRKRSTRRRRRFQPRRR